MQQEIFKDRRNFADWEVTMSSRCFVHLSNSLMWRQFTGSNPPHPPFTAKEYTDAKIPWFDYYRDDLARLSGSTVLYPRAIRDSYDSPAIGWHYAVLDYVIGGQTLSFG